MGDRQKIRLPKSSYELVIILIGTSHPGNLGAICRSMLNYGYDQLRLVNPTCDVDDIEARNRAKHAGSILDNCQTYSSLEESVMDCSLVVGTSGKREVGNKTVFRHFTYPWEFSQRIEVFNGKVALIFGEEGKGLSTVDLDRCDFLLTLPTWEGYPIANLSQAVGHCVYELHRERVKNGKMIRGVEKTRAMTPELRQILKQAISEFSHSLDSDKNELIADVFDRVILRGLPIDAEAERMIGAFVQGATALQKESGDPNWQRERRKRVRPDDN